MPDERIDRSLSRRPERRPPSASTVSIYTTPGRTVLNEWDALVERTPGTDVTQLSAWARVRASAGFSSLYIHAHRDGKLVGGAHLLHRRLPVVGRVGYVSYGPVVDHSDGDGDGDGDGDAVRTAIADALRALGPCQLRMIFVQPPEGADAVSADLLTRGFRPSSAGIAPVGSIRIDLTEDLAQIRSRFGRRLRSWPHRWEGRGVTVSVGGEQDLPLLARLMTQSAQRQGFTPPPLAYLQTLYRELAAGGNVALFVGYVHGRPVAADLVTVCGSMIRGRFAGFDRRGEAAQLSVPAAIRWEIIQWGKARGLRWLDFGGLSDATLDALLSGGSGAAVSSCDQPKLTFGGTPYRYPSAVELVTPIALRLAYDLARSSPRGRRALQRVQVALRMRSALRC
ncbi:lipid II:glycine glycyltransferase FemX [Pseudonocardia charpentierae]|uniref:GNAT family N-acetyltransferase n=1 Tax=Pseudonocardia charpentierae TaxID=3075545 RepID=A0ABU2NHY9_9PSEU|nr:GNAT family N-acetyltransferase [Pseudonocardia sp. DSM 45834]MDT0353583.1 GNAT family N-acetyltransferase [Pseudonocardia sp. DSM 45834]